MTQAGHVALAGAPNVGKSSLLNTLVGTHLAIVSPKAQATRLPVVGLRTDGDVQYVFHDLPGLLEPAYLMQARMRALALDALERMDLVLHLHPAPDAAAAAAAGAGRARRSRYRPRSSSSIPRPTSSPAARRAELADLGVVVSAATGEGIETLLARIRDHLPERDFEFDPDDVGTQQLRFFVVEYLREAAFELLDDELPYSFTAEVEEFREDRRPVYIRVTLFVERESQKGIVIGRGGRTLAAIGAHARARLEELLGAPVYLDSWVKVLPNWRRNPAALTRLGFPEPRESR